MLILGIDTSAVTCSVALLENRNMLSTRSVTHGMTHSETLLPMISEVLAESDKKISQLDCIAIAAGPGSFTGLRIGISTVKGLAISQNIPCVSVSTLEGLATNARHYEGITVCALMDARRGEFYQAFFRIEKGNAVRICEDRAVNGEKIAEEMKKESKLIILGDGAEKFVSLFPSYQKYLAPKEIRFQNGESIAYLGEAGELQSCQSLSPTYLRLPQAEREWLEKNIKI